MHCLFWGPCPVLAIWYSTRLCWCTLSTHPQALPMDLHLQLAHTLCCSITCQVFGSSINSKGFKVITGCGVIQGDGIDIEVMKKVGGCGHTCGRMHITWERVVFVFTCASSTVGCIRCCHQRSCDACCKNCIHSLPRVTSVARPEGRHLRKSHPITSLTRHSPLRAHVLMTLAFTNRSTRTVCAAVCGAHCVL